MSAEEDNRKIENSLRREAIEQGLEQGSTEKAIEIARNLLKNKVDISIVIE